MFCLNDIFHQYICYEFKLTNYNALVPNVSGGPLNSFRIAAQLALQAVAMIAQTLHSRSPSHPKAVTMIAQTLHSRSPSHPKPIRKPAVMRRMTASRGGNLSSTITVRS